MEYLWNVVEEYYSMPQSTSTDIAGEMIPEEYSARLGQVLALIQDIQIEIDAISVPDMRATMISALRKAKSNASAADPSAARCIFASTFRSKVIPEVARMFDALLQRKVLSMTSIIVQTTLDKK